MSFSDVAHRARKFASKARSRVQGHKQFFGLVQGRKRHIRDDLSILVPFRFTDDADSLPSLRVASICHIFYPDLCNVIYGTLCNLSFKADVFITTDTPSKAKYIESVFEQWSLGHVYVEVIENRGRDVYPRLHVLGRIINEYDLFVCLHSKRTLYTGFKGQDWQQQLFSCLAGSKSTTRSILHAFERDSSLGLVFPQHKLWLRNFIRWEYSFIEARKLAHRMGITLNRRQSIEFPAGSMFWIRADAIRPLVNLGLVANDFPPEHDQTTGTLAHAVERLLCYVAEASGYHWLKVSSREFIEEPSTVFEVNTPDDLDYFVKHKIVNLSSFAKSARVPKSDTPVFAGDKTG